MPTPILSRQNSAIRRVSRAPHNTPAVQPLVDSILGGVRRISASPTAPGVQQFSSALAVATMILVPSDFSQTTVT